MKERLFTADWFSHNIPNWKMLILPLLPREGVRCLEIGSYEGLSACWIIDNILQNRPNSHLDCVDLWPGMEEQERRFDLNVGNELNVTKHKGYSVEFLAPRVEEPPQYDFIYVDGGHRAELVLADALLSWRCLKTKGVMALDDYHYNGPDVQGLPPTKTAIDAFLQMHGSEIRLLEFDHQVIIQKRQNPLVA